MMQPYETLNTMLRGEQMAVEAYGKFLHEINDANTRQTLQDIRMNHNQHVSRIAERIVALGGTPAYDTGMAGVMSGAELTVKQMLDRPDRQVLKDLCSSERKGLAAAECLIQEELDKDSKAVVENILQEDRANIARLDTIVQAIQPE